MNDTSSPADSGMTKNDSLLVYDSAIDWWIAVVLALPPVTAMAVGILFLWTGRPSEGTSMLMAAGMILLVTVMLTLPCRYTLTEDSLAIRCGLIFFKRVAYAEIDSVVRSRTWASGPALSMSRVEIRAGKKTYVLSPQDRDQFIAEIQRRMPS